MRRGIRALTTGRCLIGAVLCLAQNVQIGTWALNDAKSKFIARSPRETKIVFEAIEGAVKVRMDGIGSDGKAMHSEWVGKFNGKDYPVTGDPASDMRSYTRVDDRTLGLNVRKHGDDVTSGRIQVSPDGKTLTLTVSGVDSSGRKFHSVAVYEKQR